MFIDESFCDFVGTMIIGDFFSDNEDIRVSGELLVEGPIQSFSIGDLGKIFDKRVGEGLEH